MVGQREGDRSVLARVADSKKAAGVSRLFSVFIVGPTALACLGYLAVHMIEGWDKTNESQDARMGSQDAKIGQIIDSQAKLTNDVTRMMQFTGDFKKSTGDTFDIIKTVDANQNESIRIINTELNGHESRLKCLERSTTCP